MGTLAVGCIVEWVARRGSSKCSRRLFSFPQWSPPLHWPSILSPFPITPVVLFHVRVFFVFLKFNQKTVTTMLALIAIACFVILPLTLVGTIIGKNINGQPNFPCRVNVVPRPIPEKRWFMEPAVISILGGILPFGSIFIEMYFILTSFWAYKIYYVYGFILLGMFFCWKKWNMFQTRVIKYWAFWER